MCNTWLSVEDTLPEFGTEVLVYSPQFDNVGTAVRENWGKGKYHFRWSGFGSLAFGVTHWMPKPNKPTKTCCKYTICGCAAGG